MKKRFTWNCMSIGLYSTVIIIITRPTIVGSPAACTMQCIPAKCASLIPNLHLLNYTMYLSLIAETLQVWASAEYRMIVFLQFYSFIYSIILNVQCNCPQSQKTYKCWQEQTMFVSLDSYLWPIAQTLQVSASADYNCFPPVLNQDRKWEVTSDITPSRQSKSALAWLVHEKEKSLSRKNG